MLCSRSVAPILAGWLFLPLAAVAGNDGAQEVVPGPLTEVRLHGGRPTFFVNGNPYTKPLFATYAPSEHYYRQMAAIGLDVFNFQTNCGEDPYGHSTPAWPEPDRWDFSQMDRRAGYILAAKSDAWILPRIYIEAPKWWRDRHPEALQVLDHGGTEYREGFAPGVVAAGRTYGSIASPVWREAMANALRKTVSHMLESDWGDRIFGFEIAALATEEWYPWSCNQEQLSGYDDATRTAFREWLRHKYETDEALRTAWNDPEARIDTAEVPSKEARMGDRTRTFRDPAREMPVIDLYLFYNELVANTIDFFAGVVKEATAGTKVVGAFYNYFYEFNANAEFGHNGGHIILRSPHVDFLCAPPSYHERRLGRGVECYRRPQYSGTLNGKLWFHDNDLASFLFPDVMARHGNFPEGTLRHYMEILAVTETAQESVWLFERAAGFTVCDGIYESFFDLHGGYYDHPRLLQGMRRIAGMLDRSVNHARSSVAEILVIADETSASYGTFQIESVGDAYPNRIHRALLAHQPGLIRSGAPFDAIYLDDLPRADLDRYKLVVFLNTFHMTDDQRAVVNERVKRDGRTLLWCYAPGLFNGPRRSVEAMESLAGIRIAAGPEEDIVRPTTVLTAEGREWMRAHGEDPIETPLGPDERMCALFRVDDPDAIVLGRHQDSDAVTLALKAGANFTSLYAVSPIFPAAFWRALARSAGVHVYLDTADTFYANRSYITVNSASPGRKRLKLPGLADVYDALEEDLLYENVSEIHTALMEGETVIYRYELR